MGELYHLLQRFTHNLFSTSATLITEEDEIGKLYNIANMQLLLIFLFSLIVLYTFIKNEIIPIPLYVYYLSPHKADIFVSHLSQSLKQMKETSETLKNKYFAKYNYFAQQNIANFLNAKGGKEALMDLVKNRPRRSFTLPIAHTVQQSWKEKLYKQIEALSLLSSILINLPNNVNQQNMDEFWVKSLIRSLIELLLRRKFEGEVLELLSKLTHPSSCPSRITIQQLLSDIGPHRPSYCSTEQYATYQCETATPASIISSSDLEYKSLTLLKLFHLLKDKRFKTLQSHYNVKVTHYLSQILHQLVSSDMMTSSCAASLSQKTYRYMISVLNSKMDEIKRVIHSMESSSIHFGMLRSAMYRLEQSRDLVYRLSGITVSD